PASTQLTRSLAPNSPVSTSPIGHPIEPRIGNARFAELDARRPSVFRDADAIELVVSDHVDDPGRHLRFALELDEDRSAPRAFAHRQGPALAAVALEAVLTRQKIRDPAV